MGCVLTHVWQWRRPQQQQRQQKEHLQMTQNQLVNRKSINYIKIMKKNWNSWPCEDCTKYPAACLAFCVHHFFITVVLLNAILFRIRLRGNFSSIPKICFYLVWLPFCGYLLRVTCFIWRQRNWTKHAHAHIKRIKFWTDNQLYVYRIG